MKKLHVCLALLVVFVLTAFLVGCPKKTDTETGGVSGTTPPPVLDTGGGEDTGEPGGDVAATPGSSDEVELTQEKLDMWIASMGDEGIKGISEGIADEQDTGGEGPPDMAKIFEALAASAELDEAVKAQGFADAAEWSVISRKVIAGITAGQLEKARAELEKAKAELEKAGDEAGGMGAEMVKAMEAGMPQMEELAESLGELTEAEQKVVDDNRDAIEAVMNEGPASDSE